MKLSTISFFLDLPTIKLISQLSHTKKDHIDLIHQHFHEYCEQIEPPVRMIEPASAINRATQCERESH